MPVRNSEKEGLQLKTSWNKVKSYHCQTRLLASKISKLKKQQSRGNRRKSKIAISLGLEFQNKRTSAYDII